jgi:soluble lytic murein transglycosylase-like protein
LIVVLLLIVDPDVSAAAQRYPSGRELLIEGMRYEHGRGVERNYTLAFTYYCRSARYRNATALYNIGWMFLTGQGMNKDVGVAKGWFEQAALLGDKEARKIIKALKGVNPRYDKRCAIAKSDVSKKQIETWVHSIAPKFNVDPALVLAVIGVESAFNPNALSPKNARGLMQLIPSTAKRFSVKDMWDPVENIKGGVAYLNWLLRLFKGDVKLVLAAYNAGESAVKKYNGIPPYQETQNYVSRIIENYKKTRHHIPPSISG